MPASIASGGTKAALAKLPVDGERKVSHVRFLSDRPKMFDLTVPDREAVACPLVPEHDVVASSRIPRSRMTATPRTDRVVFERLYWASVAAIVALSAAMLNRVEAAASLGAISAWTAYAFSALAFAFSTSAVVRSRRTMPSDSSRPLNVTRACACQRVRVHVHGAHVAVSRPEPGSGS
jgi:hypothetical protein